MTLEKMYSPKEKVVERGVGGSVGVLLCFVFDNDIFSLQNVFSSFH